MNPNLPEAAKLAQQALAQVGAICPGGSRELHDATPSPQDIPAKWLPKPESHAHKLVSDDEYLRLFEEARKGSDKASGVLRGIRACVAAYEMASPDSATHVP